MPGAENAFETASSILAAPTELIDDQAPYRYDRLQN